MRSSRFSPITLDPTTGYYVEITAADFTVPADKVDAAYQALCDLNAINSLKRGGGFQNNPAPDGSKSKSNTTSRWFSWMDWNYDETCKNLVEILDELGFYIEENADGSVEIIGYDNKSGDEQHFIAALALFVNPDSFITWKGEDGNTWTWKVSPLGNLLSI